MTEAELVAQMAAHGDRLWSITQYWTSVSFGILIAGHFAADRIHWSILVFFGLLYLAFSDACYGMLVFDSGAIRAGLDQLQSMVDDGEPLGHIGKNFIENAPLNNQTLGTELRSAFMALGLLLTTLAYPAYCHVRSRKSPGE
jgi:hypothetical protein